MTATTHLTPDADEMSGVVEPSPSRCEPPYYVKIFSSSLSYRNLTHKLYTYY